MVIDKMLVLSTAHVTPGIAKALDRLCQPDVMNILSEFAYRNLVIYPKGTPGTERDYGWIIYILDDANIEEAPEVIRNCIKLAKAQGCRWLMFDRDEDPIDELPTYDW